MGVLSRRYGLVVLLVGAVLVAAFTIESFDRSAPTGTRIAAPPTGSAGVAPPGNLATPQPRTAAPPAHDRAGGAIAIEGAGRAAIDSAELAGRPTNLQAGDRRAWRLTELIDGTYIHASTVIHALTIDGGDYILNDDGRRSSDVIVVRRTTGELYLAWLDGGADRPLADAELPAERIERVARISLATPAAAPDEAPARLAIVIDGKLRQTLTAASFAGAATLEIRGQREGASAAIDVARAFGVAVQVVGLTAGESHVTAAPPRPGARPVIYLTRRARFKFAWIDAAGEPIDGTRQRDVSELVLATSSKLAARP